MQSVWQVVLNTIEQRINKKLCWKFRKRQYNVATYAILVQVYESEEVCKNVFMTDINIFATERKLWIMLFGLIVNKHKTTSNECYRWLLMIESHESLGVMNGLHFTDVPVIQHRVISTLRVIQNKVLTRRFQEIYKRCQKRVFG